MKFLAGHIAGLNKIRILLSKEEKRRDIRQATRSVFHSGGERGEKREYRIRLHSHQLKTQKPNRKCTLAKEIQNYELFTIAKSLRSLVMSKIKDKYTNNSVSFSLVIHIQQKGRVSFSWKNQNLTKGMKNTKYWQQ